MNVYIHNNMCKYIIVYYILVNACSRTLDSRGATIRSYTIFVVFFFLCVFMWVVILYYIIIYSPREGYVHAANIDNDLD